MKKIDCISYSPENVPGNIKTAFMSISIHGNENPFFLSIETKVCNFFVVDEDMILFEPLLNIKENRDYIWPYIEEYSRGYMEGINEVNTLSDRFFIDGDRRVTNDIYKLTQGKRGYLSRCFYRDDYTFERCYQFGIIAGRFFKSWELIISNPDDFVRFFPEVKQVGTTGTSTKEIEVGTKDLSKLDDWFLPDQVTANKVKRLKQDIETLLPAYKKKHIAALASIIYNSGLLHSTIKPKDFKAWQEMFCRVLGKEATTYKKNQIKEEVKRIKGTFYYFSPDFSL